MVPYVDFWKNVKLYDHGEILTDIGSFIDFEDYLDPLKSVNSEDLRPEIEANRENYNEERNKFLKDPTNVIALEYAIGLGKRLLNKEKDLEIEKQLDDLQGEYAWYQSREPQRSEKEKSRLLEVALTFFTKAKSYDKAGPIYYSSKKFEKCLPITLFFFYEPVSFGRASVFLFFRGKFYHLSLVLFLFCSYFNFVKILKKQ